MKNACISFSGGFMSSIAPSAVSIQTSPQSVPSTPSWFGEVAIIAHYLTHLGLLDAIAQQVRFARHRFGHYDTIDFVAVLVGYNLSGEATLETFYDRLWPFATAFMALFGRNRLPHRSTLSRFLATIDQPTVEAFRALFQQDLLARPFTQEGEHPGGLWDRCGERWHVLDVDGTRQAARQRALPGTSDLPAASRRFEQVCAPGYLGRKRGEVVRTRTTVLQAHTSQWMGTFGEKGNGDYRGELLRAAKVIARYQTHLHFPLDHAIMRLDGLYGNGAIVKDLDVVGVGYVMRGKDYDLLDRQEIQARLALPPDQETTHPESGTCRALFDCPDVLLTPTGPRVRVIVATHPAQAPAAPIGITREQQVYDLFFTALPQGAFTPADVLALYLHRGAFETVLSDEDKEQEPDRWCSHTACGQELWQIVSQWMWNLRLELGHRLSPTPMRTTEFAPAAVSPLVQPVCLGPLPQIYGPPQWARAAHMGGFAGETFIPQPDGTLRCPAGQPLYAQERRSERDGSVRVVYAARIGHCRACLLRQQCLGYGNETKKPRRVSAVLWPILGPPPPLTDVSPAFSPACHPLLWGDWSRCQTRRIWMHRLRTQTVTITSKQVVALLPSQAGGPLTRQQRAHYRMSWAQRLARNVRSRLAPSVELHLFGSPTAFAASLGLSSLEIG
jgi:hypothetical protein